MSNIQQKIDALRAQVSSAIKELRDLEDEQFEAETLPAMQANIGKCYKYRNNYACPQSEADYWWMYAKIVGVRGGNYRMLTFQIDSYGKLEITEHCAPLSGVYIPIEQSEFLAAVRPMLRDIGREIEA